MATGKHRINRSTSETFSRHAHDGVEQLSSISAIDVSQQTTTVHVEYADSDVVDGIARASTLVKRFPDENLAIDFNFEENTGNTAFDAVGHFEATLTRGASWTERDNQTAIDLSAPRAHLELNDNIGHLLNREVTMVLHLKTEHSEIPTGGIHRASWGQRTAIAAAISTGVGLTAQVLIVSGRMGYAG